MRTVSPYRWVLRSSLAMAALLVGAPLLAASGDRYGHYNVVEGSASVIQDGATQAAQENQPLLTGDRLWTNRGSRVEVVLADGSLLRAGGDTEVGFEQLAGSQDAYADSNYLALERGELQLVTSGSETRVDTDNATVYMRESGTYRVESRDGTTLVVVRGGSAEVRTRNGAVYVRQDQEAWIEGDAAPDLAAAGNWDSLERWASSLDDAYRQARYDDGIDDSLRYSARRLHSYGSWSTYQGRRYWRPRVGAGWSPYHHGRWSYTPSGLTWISYEPWGWVPYHYGTWDYLPGWGWAWYPGRVYAPAWVYWYWGPSYVGWCPIGYYGSFYGPRHYSHWGFDLTWGFGFGVHGWAGGHHRRFDRWHFVDCRRLYNNRIGDHVRTAVQIGGELPRGIISTDTRGLGPAVATRPSEAIRVLARGGGDGNGGWTKPMRELPDVSRFVARDPNVSGEVARVAMPVRRELQGERGGRDAAATGVRGALGARTATGTGEKTAAVGATGDEGVTGAVGRTARGRDTEAGKPAGDAVGTAVRGRAGEGWRAQGAQPGTGERATGGTGASPSRSGVTNGVRGARPGSDEGWRGGATSPGTDRPDGATMRDRARQAAPRGESPGGAGESWRSSGGAGAQGTRGAREVRPPASESWRGIVPGRQQEGARTERPDSGAVRDGWRDSGAPRTGSPRSSSVPRTVVPDESWRSQGRQGGDGTRSPVRRIVEGVRSNQAREPVPQYDLPSSRSVPRSSTAPDPSSYRRSIERQPRPDSSPGVDRSPSPSQVRESARERYSDPSPSRSSVDQGDRGSRGSSRDRGDAGARSRQGGGERSGARSSRPRSSGESNR